jgi:hypothetical protein
MAVPSIICVMRRWPLLAHVGAIVGIGISVMAHHAWGQESRPGDTRDQPAESDEQERLSPLLRSPSEGGVPTYPNLTSYPVELLGLLAPPGVRGPFTLLPAIAVSEEYNDNLSLDNQNKQWDFITSLSPALMLLANSPTFQAAAGYSFTAELYARDKSLNNTFAHHHFIGSAVYAATQRLKLSVSDEFVLNRTPNFISAHGYTTGQQDSWTNIFTPGLGWQMTQRTFLTLSGSYSVQRFTGEGSGSDSDTYYIQSSLDYAISPRFRAVLGYNFTYLDLKGEGDSTSHNPNFGFSYRVTPLLTAIITGGPAITLIGGDTSITPAGTASLVYRLRYGSASVQYTRSVTVAGGFGGTNDTQTVSGTLLLPAWRDMILIFTPEYGTSKSVSSGQREQVDVNVFTLSLGVTYQIARYVSVFGGYTFLRQRTGGASTLQVDANQNRIKAGLQFGYPFNFNFD